MKSKLFLLCTILLTAVTFAQDITFSFVNARNTNDGTDDFFEAEIHVASTVDYIAGLGNTLFNYNPLAFGENIGASGNFEFITTEGLVSQTLFGGALAAYGPFVVNDNTNSRVSIFYDQAVSSGLIGTPNVLSTGTTHLFSIRIRYIDINQSPNVTFATTADNPAFTGLYTTACGPETGGPKDCTNSPGIQLVNDSFDSSGAIPNNDTLSITDFDNKIDSAAVLLTQSFGSLQVISPSDLTLTEIKIFNIAGVEAVNSNTSTIGLSSLPRGIYIAVVGFEQGIVVRKFIK